ncbi:hypothetical protein AAZX31_08G066000 [Glycine max]|nr:hypothetical protein GLYMA_08G067781v4 [Glycine max]KAG4999486.1 hypothetical protein JHK87_020558 [Glycine soja]KAG5024754.1 hypothetical protein JHK86_020668 [Glycine max]KAG5135924.1 hypothetical protein JHK82_020655 [Glycine max]
MASKCESWMILGLLIAISFSSMHMDMAFAARNLLPQTNFSECVYLPVPPFCLNEKPLSMNDLPDVFPPNILPIP